MDEVWKNINGYDGTFQISTFGNVRRMKSPSGKTLIGIKNLKTYKNPTNGYVSIALWKNGKKTRHRINRLVAETFLYNDDKNKNIVHHKNFIRDDNRIENLEWVTLTYNLKNKMPKTIKKDKMLNRLLQVLKEMNLLKEEKIDISEISRRLK